MTTKEIRKAFLTFFEGKLHKVVPSAPIVVKDDPTLMFTNAGMNQFKDLFLGEATVKFPRVADTQRCLRVSGKHNDLEEVGIDTYHHTMFEMLGNWSFGDYFKKEAISWSWELLTEVYKIPKEQLYVSVFQGDEKEGLAFDQESFDLWKQFVPEERIVFGNKKDNFWEMGDTGPCGPCSEIHVDCRPAAERKLIEGKSRVNADDPQVIEIWNNVFMQYNRLKDGSLQQLPAKHVDTGMGLERLVRVLQQKMSNYDTDVFQPLIQHIAAAAKLTYGTNEKQDIAMRVMADHIRAIAFAIADGTLPSNNKAGYVIRRILRRAVRYAYQYLGFKEPFMNTLVPVLAEQFEGVFDELPGQKDFVQKVVLEEELSFLRTLDNGLKYFDEYWSEAQHSIDSFAGKTTAESGKVILSGSSAFKLSDTFGFPIDLIELIAKEKGGDLDLAGYEEFLQLQKARSRAATTVDASDWVIVNAGEEVEFVGYDGLETECQILKYRKINAKGKEQYQVVLNRTPFYAESGGQVGDNGKLEDFSRLFEYQVTDTKKENGLVVHYMDHIPDEPQGKFWAIVNADDRSATESNHSATHLLHAALKQVLGDHVNQKGSLVNPNYLRFDFSHFAKMTAEELVAIEEIVNHKVRENIPLKEERNVPYQEAINSGVTALFGEKYGDFVRMITFGDHFSKELCGGTHVRATGQIGYFKIISESAVAAGVRRIEAITADAVDQYIREQDQLVQQLKGLLRNPKELAVAVEQLLDENNRLKKELGKAALGKASGLKDELAAKATVVNGFNFIAARVDLPNADAIKSLAYSLKEAVDDLFLVLTYENDGKPGVTVMVAENLVSTKNLHAGNIVRELAKEIQGGGGGQPFYATAGGKDASGLDRVLEKANALIS